MNKEQTLLSLVAAGELEIDPQGNIWRVAKRHGRGVADGGAYAKGTRTSPCRKVRAEYRTRQGYLLVTTMIAGKKTVTGAHRIIWTHFNGPIPRGLTINHRNGVKDDNRPENLELATYSQQRRHALDVLNVNRNRPIGSKNPKTHLTEEDVLEIRRLREEGAMLTEIAPKFKMNPKALSAICNRRTWKHI